MVDTSLENKDLQKRTRRLEALTHALTDLSKISFGQSPNLDAIYKKIAKIVAEAIDVGRVGLWFYDHDREYLVCRGWYGLEEAKEGTDYKIKCSDIPKYLEAVEGIRYLDVVDVATDERTAELMSVYIKSKNIKSMLDSSIRSMSGPKGIICCESVGEVREWTHDEKAFSASVADIVARVAQEFEQFQQGATFKAVIDHISEGTMILDSEGRYKYVSPAMEKMTGFTQKDLEGKKLGFSMDDGEKGDAWGIMSKIIAGDADKVYSLEREFPKKDGSKTNILSFVYNMMDVPGINGIVIINRDVSELREAENQLVRAKKMEVLGQLTGGLAHDFNNLLTIISGNSHLLSNYLVGNEHLLALVSEIKYATMRGSEQINRLLSISRNRPTKLEKAQLGNIILNMEQVLNNLLSKDINLELNLGRTNWQVEMDVGSFENALLNLVLNSKDAMPDGGTIRIETSKGILCEPLEGAVIEVPAGKYVVISIKDDGRGMDKKTVERAVEPFFTTKESGEGTGLGLSMVYRFLEGAKGGLTIESALGEGAEFKLYLPRSCGSNESDEVSGESDDLPEVCGGRILAVDDESALLRLLINVLEPEGYEVLTATNAQEGIDTLKANPDIRAVITDVVMPGVLNGFDLALFVKENHPRVPVLMLSGYSEKTLAQDEKYKVLAPLIMEKPIDYVALVKKLNTELGAISKL